MFNLLWISAQCKKGEKKFLSAFIRFQRGVFSSETTLSLAFKGIFTGWSLGLDSELYSPLFGDKTFRLLEELYEGVFTAGSNVQLYNNQGQVCRKRAS